MEEFSDHLELSFDIVIIGGGPSAAGLLHGLLMRLLKQSHTRENDRNADETIDVGRDKMDDGSSVLSNVRIAILERGSNSAYWDDYNNFSRASRFRKDEQNFGDATNSVHNIDNRRCATDFIRINQQIKFSHPHPSSYSLQNWFIAAHYTSHPTSLLIPETVPPSPTLLHTTVPQTHLHNRILDVPTGVGWGGSTNIHAGLVMAPDFGRENRDQNMGDNRDENGSGDFQNWPGRWKGGQCIKKAVKKILRHLEENGFLNSASSEKNNDVRCKYSASCLGVVIGSGDSSDDVGQEGGGNIPHWKSYLRVCSGGKTFPREQAMEWEKGFQQAVTSSTISTSNEDVISVEARKFSREEKNGNGSQHGVEESSMPTKRVNYFTALIEPLIKNYPELRSYVTFLSGMQAERVLIDSGCDGCDCQNFSTAGNELSSSRSGDSEGMKEYVNGQEGRKQDTPRTKGHSYKVEPEHDAFSRCRRPRAWAVECLFKESSMLGLSDRRNMPNSIHTNKASTSNSCPNHHRILIRSKHEIIVCAGAIGSPALLLASGIGHEDDLRDAQIFPWYEQRTCPIHVRQIYRHLPVGHNLRDHILLPRPFLTPRQNKDATSINSIHGWWMLDIPIIGQSNSTTHQEHGSAKIQLQLADGILMDSMIPHFASAAIRRKWILPFWNYEVPFDWIYNIYCVLRYLFQAVFVVCPIISPGFREWIRHHSASINICLLNPKSVGKVTIFPKRKLSLQYSQSYKRIIGTHKSIPPPTRLSECQMAIDPGYLSNPKDVDALWAGWNASTQIERRWYGGCIGIHCGKTVEWFSNYAAEFVNPYYHWCGTCSMGEGTKVNIQTRSVDSINSFVVDEKLRVQAIGGLRICDASIFPDCISAPTALTCAGVGLVASQIIFDDFMTSK